MRIRVIRLTPKKAQELLDNRAPNRRLDEAYAHRLAGAIVEGKWVANGETIKINEDGQMEDGQHRCRAVVIANTSVSAALATGIPAQAGTFESIDTGKKRTGGQMLGRAGEKHYNALAAAAGWMWRHKSGKVASFESPRHDQLMDVIDKHPGLRYSANFCTCARTVMSHGLATFVHYLLSEKDCERANRFMDMLGSGEHLSKSNGTSAILRLREELRSDRDRRTRKHAYVIAALCIKAWNAWVNGKRVARKVTWEPSEGFPKVEEPK